MPNSPENPAQSISKYGFRIKKAKDELPRQVSTIIHLLEKFTATPQTTERARISGA
ncbi:hypothetical protein LEP1GSC058_3992 [Leptospira fainei serovar Hurstbridge str. BUT 6]|uniref:Uncharacterized protein n=1 Tax=Leptospira fainei serovar Hurstbridge str. BUT 6 TaxID=1193011 RepID=S3UVN4_9LEPT|nr:hypothetical protein LEP1GSC058_3992 [Leptospira fainei serovar Hurstbridge str. BUT 6]